MDFYTIETRPGKGKNKWEIYPEYKVCRSKDLIIRGGNFYVVYDEETGKWTEDKVVIQNVIDSDIQSKYEKLTAAQEKRNCDEDEKKKYIPKYLGDFSSNHWTKFDQYVRSLPDTKNIVLDKNVTFQGQVTTQKDYVSKELPYSLSDGPYDAWNEMIGTLYDPEEREKIEWAIGAILCGDAKKIQKFLVFYGPQGSGKSTILNIVMKLFEGYYATFKAESLVNSSDQFGCKFLSSNPLVAIDEDTNLSRIETNATINKIASHEELEVNEKYKSQYVVKPMCMMMLGTNKPVRITDAKSGIIRRLIDIEPSGRKITPIRRYERLNRLIEQQLGAIAKHCMDVYQDESRGPHYYDDYVPERMMYRTDPFFNFMQEHFEEYKKEPYVLASVLWTQWKDYCNESGIEFTKKRYEIVDEAKNYFREFHKETTTINGVQVRSRFAGLKTEKFLLDKQKKETPVMKESADIPSEAETAKKTESDKQKDIQTDAKTDIQGETWLRFDKTESLLDQILAEYPAQYDTGNSQYPLKYKWKDVKTKLKDLDTRRTHFVQGFSEKLICVDFDRKGPDGKKDLQANIRAASNWTPTYAELSNSGAAIHLHYWYDGDVNELSSLFDDDIEIKVFPNDKELSLRRRVSGCNDLPIAHISSGLPFKEKKTMVDWQGLQDEKHLRNTVMQAVRKEIRPYGAEPKTITCMKYIRDLLKNAQESKMNYDIRDLDEMISAFAMHSHNNSKECMDIYYSLDLVWPRVTETTTRDPMVSIFDKQKEEDKPIIILDCEVIKNLTLVVYKELEPDNIPAINKAPKDRIKKCVRLYNPSPNTIAELLDRTRMVGHNVIKYDDYILYALILGKTPEEISEISNRIIHSSSRDAIPFGWYIAKDLSYADTYDISNGDNRKGLKKIEIEMKIPHKEMEIDWSKPLPEEEWETLAQYCENDVMATEAFFMSKSFQTDFKARKILASLTGMSVNDTTNNLTAQLIFGDVKNPQSEFNKPDLQKMFPEYRMEYGKSYYGDELIGEGGRVYAKWGAYYDVVTFDVASMHPTSIIVENGFGPYTKHYEDLYRARIAIKHKDYEAARKMFGGRLAPYLESDEDADALSYALKIALNSVYGMTAASFKNRFRDERNIDNWVAKRGALFMEKLRREVLARGGTVVHIKTDSIKLEKPTKELADFVVNFGKQYGYNFEIESHYERMCLVNNAVYIALRAKDDPGWLKECDKARKRAEKTETPYIEPTRWTATGAQFAQPYVFKRIFSHEPMVFDDFCETKHVKTSLYLDMNEHLPDVSLEEKEKAKIKTRMRKLEKDLHNPDLHLSEEDCEKIMNELEDLPKDIEVLDEKIAKGHSYVFVGGTGEFMPVIPGCGGGLLMRKEDDGGFGYATGAKGYRWVESENMRNRDDWKKYIDIRYFRGLVDDAVAAIGLYCDFNLFVQGEDNILLPEDRIVEYDTDPWMLPCKSETYAYCSDCPDFENDEQGNCICKKGYNITNQILGESKEILV